MKARFLADPGMTGAQFYPAAHEAERCGWLFGGKIAGHLVDRFPCARRPGNKAPRWPSPENVTPVRNREPEMP